MKTKIHKGVVLKVDLAKAYDKVSWKRCAEHVSVSSGVVSRKPRLLLELGGRG